MNSEPIENAQEQRSGGYHGIWLFRILIWAVWLIGILAILILFVLPVLANWLLSSGHPPKGMSRYFELLTVAQTWLMRILGAVWIFFLGSCFASFLNVVAWRVPRGGSINGSSHCPDCNQRLRFRDNTPVIGWVRNGGQCSNCQLPIPIRYLLVEVLLGALFLLLTSVQLLSGGWNLPFRPMEKLSGFEHLIFDPKPDLILLTVYHLVLICLLFTFTLIKNETLKIPRRVWFVGLVLGVVIPLIWPAAHLVSWKLGQSTPTSSISSWTDLTMYQGFYQRGSFDQTMTLGLGLLVGILLGTLLKRFRSGPEAEHPYIFQPTFIGEEVAGLSLIGLFLGWQSATSVSLFAVVLLLLFRLSRVKWNFAGPTGCLLLASLLHLLCWRISTNCPYWPSGRSTFFGLGWVSFL